MPKLLWAALPLLLAAAWVGVQALRGRAPSRHALNVGSSVLLLGYVLATAGLGIFWVANQQLPVFDWHYLFGYATVVLVALHLAFNFRVVWRYVTRRTADAPVRTGVVAPGRRGALGLLGAALAGGVAFALGLRQGRRSLQGDAAPQARGPTAGDASAGHPSAGDPAAAALALVERFHALSSHSRAGVFLRAPGTDWGDPPPPFKRYPGAPRTVLPRPGHRAGAEFDVGALGSVLWHAAGVSEVRGGLRLRTSPSSGALFPSELYVIVQGVPGLAPGAWHYDPDAHALERLALAVDARALEADGGSSLAGATAIVVATAVFRRTGHKYGDRTYRYVLADLGHALENLRVAAAAGGAKLRPVVAFDEAVAAAALGLDEAEEGVLAMAALHHGAGREARAVPAPVTARWQARPLVRDRGSAPGATAAIHAATSLQATLPRPAHAARAQSDRADASPRAVLLPQPDAAHSDVLQVIATRRSVRRFADAPLPLAGLAAVLARMTQPAPVWSAAVRIDVVVHAVDALAPGSYRYDAARQALLPRRTGIDLRAAARAAALDQDVIGDGAVAIVLSIARADFAADPLGAARGYRHAFLEAGLVGERIYLEAGARGLGACAVGAFYDEEAAALVGIDPLREWVVHFAGVGIPAR